MIYPEASRRWYKFHEMKGCLVDRARIDHKVKLWGKVFDPEKKQPIIYSLRDSRGGAMYGPRPAISFTRLESFMQEKVNKKALKEYVESEKKEYLDVLRFTYDFDLTIKFLNELPLRFIDPKFIGGLEIELHLGAGFPLIEIQPDTNDDFSRYGLRCKRIEKLENPKVHTKRRGECRELNRPMDIDFDTEYDIDKKAYLKGEYLNGLSVFVGKKRRGNVESTDIPYCYLDFLTRRRASAHPDPFKDNYEEGLRDLGQLIKDRENLIGLAPYIPEKETEYHWHKPPTERGPLHREIPRRWCC